MSDKLPRRFLLHFLLASTLVVLCPAGAAAWGRSGHRIIALIAERRLEGRAVEEVSLLLGKDDLAAVSTYADDIRLTRPETSNWHFVVMPRDATAYVPARDCVETKNGVCAVAAIERMLSVLASGAKFEERQEALKFIVHLVADLHQPLHCGCAEDLGGNAVTVYFDNRKTRLHTIWDTDLIARAKKDDIAYFNDLHRALNSLRDKNRPAYEKMLEGTPADWAYESHRVALEGAYKLSVEERRSFGVPPRAIFDAPARRSSCASQTSTLPSLGDKYYQQNLNAVETQLMRGGVRLALLLNRAFNKGASPPSPVNGEALPSP